MSELADELYRIPEAARILKVWRSTIYRMIDRDEIKSVHVGGSVRIPRGELERLLQGEPEGARLATVKSIDRKGES